MDKIFGLGPTPVLDPYIPIATLRQHILEESQYISSSTDTFLTAKWDPCICFQSWGYCLVSHDCSEPNQKQHSETRAVHSAMNWKESFWLTSSNSSTKVKGKSYTMKRVKGNYPEFLSTELWTAKHNDLWILSNHWWVQLPHFWLHECDRSASDSWKGIGTECASLLLGV